MMGATRVWQSGILLLALLAVVSAPGKAASASICPRENVFDSIVGFRDRNCVAFGDSNSFDFAGVTEGDEVWLQKALDLVHKNSDSYVALLFYASWCPFSRIFRPTFSLISYLYPHIPHFAIEESSIRPSILSKYGVHRFPTLLLLNSTMRVRYHGSRTLGSLVAFYSDVTGIKTASLDKRALNKIRRPPNHEKNDPPEQDNCPFSWAKSPDHLFRQETYLALATVFVLLRVLYLCFPAMIVLVRYAWGRFIRSMILGSMWERPRACLNRVMQLLNILKDPCKRSNLQGAMSAGAWASKSLATVTIGDASTSRGASTPMSKH